MHCVNVSRPELLCSGRCYFLEVVKEQSRTVNGLDGEWTIVVLTSPALLPVHGYPPMLEKYYKGVLNVYMLLLYAQDGLQQLLRPPRLG